MNPLPVDALLPDIAESLRHAPNLVVEAPPGAGKTTRVPSYLLDTSVAEEIWVLEPRRLAARMAARRVAEERGERLGATVGYQVRFDEVAGPRTRLRFVTEGILTRRLLSDPALARVGAVVLDEFHERHLDADIALALLRRLQHSSRPDLRLVAMSATLDAAPVAAYLDDCPVLRSEGRLFDVAVEYLPRSDERPLEEQVASAVRRLAEDALDGDVLVFLPGAREIRRAQEACAQIAARYDVLVLPLHGDLPADEQDRAVRPAGRRKIILSTNVAETSVTVDGVVAVVDSGLARVAGHSSWSGLPTLGLARVSRASATQRAGRAGRTRPGRCVRLYTAQDFAARPEFETPEVLRTDLAGTVLELHAAGVADPRAFPWFEAPPDAALDTAERLLRRLGAIDAHGRMTETGDRMLRFPLHPRLARLVVEAHARGVSEEGALVAALAGERDIRGRDPLGGRRGAARGTTSHGPSDLLELADRFAEAERAHFDADRLRGLGLDPGAARAVERARRQILGRGPGPATRGSNPTVARNLLQNPDRDTAVLMSILAGYPDRVARRKAPNSENLELMLGAGGAAELAPESVVRRDEFLVAVDAEERRGAGAGRRGGATVVRLASAIEPDWLLDLFPDAIRESSEVRWNAREERVEAVSRLLYDNLVLDESRAMPGEEAARLLAEAARGTGLGAFGDREAVDRFLARVHLVSQHFPEAEFPALGEEDVAQALDRLCEGKRSFAELREAVRAGGLVDALRSRLSGGQARLLASAAPDRVSLARGRQVRVNYELDKPPWIASRLQDFFGMREGPRVANGRAALVLHLLAPNQRPVQVTSDLAGFWLRHYPQVRRELGRRYPRHAWPEDPG
jgi:ATP-dependent helicase HrpB